MATRLLLINYDDEYADDGDLVSLLIDSIDNGDYIELPITPEQQKPIDDNDKRAMQS